MKLLLILSIVIVQAVSAQTTPNYAKETRWAVQVEDTLMDGDSVWLSANNHEFLSIFTPSESDTKKTAIIVHGLGAHPDWVQVIQPLRVVLTEKGFNTFSIQVPVLANGVDADQYEPLFNQADNRITTAINYLKAQGFEANTLIAHSLGGVMSAHYLANNQHSFKEFIAIGMPDLAVEYLTKIDIPMLDLYGVDDIEPVLSSVKARANASSKNKNYHQKMVNADHFFNEKDDLLIDTVSTWLN